MAHANKLVKYKWMTKWSKLAPYLPETARFNERQFRRLLDKYGDIVVKPNGGSRGRNVIRVFYSGNGRYTIHHENKQISVLGLTNAKQAVMRRISSENYIVQRRIRLATVNRQPFDVRVIVQRKAQSNKWEVTGKLAKLAGKGYIVTNLTRSGGSALPFSKAIQKSSIENRFKKGLVSELNTVAVYSAHCLRSLYPKQRIYGLDVGIDNKGFIWIIEANKHPSMSHFRKLGAQKTIRRIMSFKRTT
ncbi:YheC/YheD family protein [Paenibacillus sp. GCM10012307]|uniref:YheC/YheD family protein n=1 Tax=Paenibacillus roseus TaxID=2798579 RepID=A0A934IXX1_9BACL|nr:YheC/YheD family protein [Paenibacillus roseus]MBJ6359714.1 YheC/YheD family protein [Paenibacillus roseus]